MNRAPPSILRTSWNRIDAKYMIRMLHLFCMKQDNSVATALACRHGLKYPRQSFAWRLNARYSPQRHPTVASFWQRQPSQAPAAMDGDPPLLPESPLQSLILSGVVREVPRNVALGLWALPLDAALPCFHAALALFSAGSPPALPPAKVFAALRHGEFSVFDLTAPPVLAELRVDQSTSMLADLLIAQGERCPVERVAVRTSHVASARAVGLLLRLIVSGGRKFGSLREVVVQGAGGSEGELSRANVQDIAEALGGNLRTLLVPGLAAVDDERLEALMAGAGGALEELDVSMTSVTGAGIRIAFAGAECSVRGSMRVLDLGGTSVDTASLLALVGLERLENLSLAWTPAVRPPGRSPREESVEDMAEAGQTLGAVLATLLRLERLDLSGATVDLGRHVLDGLHGVRELILASARIDDAMGEVLLARRLPPSLEHLDLSSVCGTAPILPLLQAVGERTGGTLRRICVAQCELPGWDQRSGLGNDVTNEVALAPGMILTFGRLLCNLRELDVGGAGSMPARALLSLLACTGFAARIEKLCMRQIDLPDVGRRCQAYDQGLDGSGVRPPVFVSLRHLDVSDSALADEPARLACLISRLTVGSQIETLHVGGARHLTYGVVASILQASSATLTNFDMSFCPFPAADGHSVVAHLSLLRLPRLRSVNVNGCGTLPRTMIDLLLTQAPALEEVVAADGTLAGVRLGRAEDRRRLGAELVLAAEEERRASVARTPWRTRNAV
jgi:hypothetical protein